MFDSLVIQDGANSRVIGNESMSCAIQKHVESLRRFFPIISIDSDGNVDRRNPRIKGDRPSAANIVRVGS